MDIISLTSQIVFWDTTVGEHFQKMCSQATFWGTRSFVRMKLPSHLSCTLSPCMEKSLGTIQLSTNLSSPLPPTMTVCSLSLAIFRQFIIFLNDCRGWGQGAKVRHQHIVTGCLINTVYEYAYSSMNMSQNPQVLGTELWYKRESCPRCSCDCFCSLLQRGNFWKACTSQQT